jgi:hypothetical protein
MQPWLWCPYLQLFIISAVVAARDVPVATDYAFADVVAPVGVI